MARIIMTRFQIVHLFHLVHLVHLAYQVQEALVEVQAKVPHQVINLVILIHHQVINLVILTNPQLFKLLTTGLNLLTRLNHRVLVILHNQISLINPLNLIDQVSLIYHNNQDKAMIINVKNVLRIQTRVKNKKVRSQTKSQNRVKNQNLLQKNNNLLL